MSECIDELLTTQKNITFRGNKLLKLHDLAPSNAAPMPPYISLHVIAFYANLTAPSKQFLTVKLLLDLHGQLSNL